MPNVVRVARRPGAAVLGSALLAIAIPAAPASAQDVDTLQVRRLLEMQAELDSLRAQVRGLHDALQDVKQDVAEGSDLDRMLAAFEEEAVESIPEDQRSRRRRVDALLRIVTEQPGHLRLNGGATAFVQGSFGPDRFSIPASVPSTSSPTRASARARRSSSTSRRSAATARTSSWTRSLRSTAGPGPPRARTGWIP